ncbi:hypothetical protein CAPTEDRAFT_189861, partial [Capitella teleta]
LSDDDRSLLKNERTFEAESLKDRIVEVHSDYDSEPVRLKENRLWVDKRTRPSCKYAPVLVAKGQNENAIKSMRLIKENRIELCRNLKSDGAVDDHDWYSFTRGTNKANELPQSSKYSTNTEPLVVLSGGSAKKIRTELEKDFSLAWHPENLRGEPVYLLVHRLDFENYSKALKEALNKYENLHLIGWDGGELTGFGAARAAALSFAHSLPYNPERILMLDQDVVQTEATRHTNPLVKKNIEDTHNKTGKDVVAYGVGYPTRQTVPRPFSSLPQPKTEDYNSPAQQFVSIKAPFLSKGNRGLYPEYMVSGGEDMLMGRLLGLSKDKKNTVLLENPIVKKELLGEADTNNDYWNKARVETLKNLFDIENSIQVDFDGSIMTLNELMHYFVDNNWIASHPSPESYNVASSIVERIILRFHSEE